jgi:hypothetical protein
MERPTIREQAALVEQLMGEEPGPGGQAAHATGIAEAR